MTFLLSQLAQSYSNQTSYYTHATTNTADPALMAGFLLFMFVFVTLAYAVTAWLLGRIFAKAGVPQWIAWVPFYSTWKMLELGDQQGFWAVLAVIPIVNYVSTVFVYIAMYRIGMKFGKESWWVVLAIFLPIVWLALLAFDKSHWNAAPISTAS